MKILFNNLALAGALCLLMTDCAQEGPPLPPSLELPKPPTDLRATRKGNAVTLTWSAPTNTTDRLGIRTAGLTIICRSSKAQFTSCENPVGKLSSPASTVSRSRKKKSAKKTPPTPAIVESFTDTLPESSGDQDARAEITYAVQPQNRNGRAAGLSNIVHVSALATLPAPVDVRARLSGDGVALVWRGAAGQSNGKATGQAPSIQYRYRIYRRDEASGKDAIAGEVGMSSGEAPPNFTDTGFEWEKTYSYRVTGVTIVTGLPEGELQVEGDDSSSVRIVAHDVFPPAVPAGLQAAFSGEGQKPFVDLIWAPVVASDLAGYNIYRAEENEREKIVKVNSDLVKSPSYRDSEVTSRKAYIYSVSSVDSRGNESQKSESASEAVP